ncbi:hypothetical protein ACFX19_011547 [Malus domestica]
MEHFEVYQEKDRLGFEIRDITAQLDNPGNHDQNPTSVQQPVQLLVKFVHNFHYKFTNTAIDRTETTIKEYDRIKERSCGFDIDKLKDYKYSFGIFTSMLLLTGVRIRREAIVKLIINGGLKIRNKYCYRGRQVLGLHVYVRSEYLRVRCNFCTVGRGTRMMEARLAQLTNDDNSNKGMVPASYPAINKVLKRVRVGSTSADDGESPSHDDVEEEGRERKRRKIRFEVDEELDDHVVDRNLSFSVRPVQLLVKFVYRRYKRINRFVISAKAMTDTGDKKTEKICQFDMDLLKELELHGILCSMLEWFGIKRAIWWGRSSSVVT